LPGVRPALLLLALVLLAAAGCGLQQNVHVKVPYVSATQALLTKEWTPLEPGVLDHKYYLRGVGTVLEQSVRGPLERNALTGFFQRGQ